jgi:MoxR-like ATPase
LDSLAAAIELTDLRELQSAVEDVYIDPILQRWVIDLVRATRELAGVQIGASVRGSLALERGARAVALLAGRDYVEPSDIERLVEPVLSHRLLLTPTYGLADDATQDHQSLLARCLERAPRPAPALRTRD